uniref:Uncharacterized protein n=1 Tax=Panagrolaimus sp. JU765 TaxID=591449 RepID=A0AC34QIN6_9BILA
MKAAKPCERVTGHKENDPAAKYRSDGKIDRVKLLMRKYPVVTLFPRDVTQLMLDMDRKQMTAYYQTGTELQCSTDRLSEFLLSNTAHERLHILFVGDDKTWTNYAWEAFTHECRSIRIVGDVSSLLIRKILAAQLYDSVYIGPSERKDDETYVATALSALKSSSQCIILNFSEFKSTTTADILGYLNHLAVPHCAIKSLMVFGENTMQIF